MIKIFLIFSIDWTGEIELDPEKESHEEYLALFKRTLIQKLIESFDESLKNDPDGGKGKKKTVQVNQNTPCY